MVIEIHVTHGVKNRHTQILTLQKIHFFFNQHLEGNLVTSGTCVTSE